MRLSDRKRSPELSSAFRKMRVETFGDLSGVCLRNFQRVSRAGGTLFLEVRELIRRARQGDFAASSLPHPGTQAGPIALNVPRPAMPLPAASPSPQTEVSLDVPAAKPDSPADEIIFIPQEARGTPLSAFQLSARLQHIFEAKGFRLFGDVHGLALTVFLKFRDCGKKTVAELQELVHAVQRAHQTTTAGAERVVVHEPPPSVFAGALFIPASVQSINAFDLPLSARLEGALRKRKIIRLGDLHGACLTRVNSGRHH